MTPIEATFTMLRAIRRASDIKASRSLDDVFADRILQAANQPKLAACIQLLSKTMHADVSRLNRAAPAFLQACTTPDAPRLLLWLRENSRLAALIAAIKEDAEFATTLSVVELAPATDSSPEPPPQPTYDVPISVALRSPLAHGSDDKAGNNTLFRRLRILVGGGRIQDIPYYAGNAIRGQMRDLLADHFLHALGFSTNRSKPGVQLWFFHVLYAGGVLKEGSMPKALGDMLGNHGSFRCAGINGFRDTFPALSLLGCALGNRVLPGRICVGHLLPACKELGTGPMSAHQLLDWTYITRRDDSEADTDADSNAMIANTEVLRAGSELSGGIDIDTHCSDVERAALGRGIQLLQSCAKLGAENRHGLGNVQITGTGPDPALYDQYLADHASDIRQTMSELGACI